MAVGRGATVTNRPVRPLVLFDGECCQVYQQWVRRWRAMTVDRVDYRPFPQVGPDDLKIAEVNSRERAWLIEPDGQARDGAGAVSRLHTLGGGAPWSDGHYAHAPVFARGSEAMYEFAARHRNAATSAVRRLQGSIERRPSYRWTRALFLRGMGLVYLAAFWSLAVQADGLFGSRGIAPIGEFLDQVRQTLGEVRFHQVPTVFWLGSSDQALHVVCWGGVALSGLLILGILAGECLALLWVGYLSLVSVGRPFLEFQWDMLLLEAGLLAILLAPWGLRMSRAIRGPSPLAIWLVRWLLFRLIFLSGVVKLASGDPVWAAWQAMRYYYETQPLPTWTSWSMHQLPSWFQMASVGFLFGAELVAPFLVFGPRRVRMAGCVSIVLLQVLIAATGNYGFFNLLTIVLCLTLVEDRDWGRKDLEPVKAIPRPRPQRAFLGMATALIVMVTSMEAVDRTSLKVWFPGPLEEVRRWVAPFRSMNAYGLFAVMATDRSEIEIEGSEDGDHWKPYAFRWKPGDIARAPRFATPHLPRLDWQMWFAALSGDCRRQPWFLAFERRLLEGSSEVLGLLRDNPFPAAPPRFLRARLDRYHFTGRGERAWWRRETIGWFCPALSH